MKDKMDNLLEQISEHDYIYNIKLIAKTFGSLFYKNNYEESILHLLVQTTNEEKSFFAIKSLLETGFNPNLVDDEGRNFIQSALIHNCSSNFILKILKEAINHKLNVNHGDYEFQTIGHTALLCNYNEDVVEIIRELIFNGFDLSLRDSDNNTIYDILKVQNKQKDYIRVKSCEAVVKQRKNNQQNIRLLETKEETKNIPKNVAVNTPLLTSEELKKFEKFGSILNYKSYTGSPAVAREKELKNLMITLAQDLISPIIVGESGVGKSALVHELVFRIKRGEVPKFLKDRLVFEINPGQVVAGCSHVGEFEENMNECMNLCKKHNVIAFIDEIHTIYGVGSSKGKDTDMAQMLKYYLDRSSFKVIGATTAKEYEEYFNTDALKRRFEKIVLKEPEDEVLYKIVDKILDDYCKNKKINFENENIKQNVLNILLEVTSKKYRRFDDKINNPALVISIIDKAFAIASVFDESFITEEHFIQGLEFNNRIYDSVKEKAIKNLNNTKTFNKDVPIVLKFEPKK